MLVKMNPHYLPSPSQFWAVFALSSHHCHLLWLLLWKFRGCRRTLSTSTIRHGSGSGSTFFRGNEKLFNISQTPKQKFARLPRMSQHMITMTIASNKKRQSVRRRWTVSPQPLIEDVFICHWCSSKQDVLDCSSDGRIPHISQVPPHHRPFLSH